MNNFRKNFIWNICGTSLNAFNSLFFLIIVTRINGLENAGIFTLAFSTACILYVIGIYSGRIFQVTENGKITDKDYIASKIITTIIMVIISILFVVVKGYSLYKSSIFILLCIYKALEAFSETFYAILQKNEELYKVGKSLFFKSLIAIVLFLVVDIVLKNIIISCSMIILANILIIVFYDIPNTNKIIDKKEKASKQNVKQIFKTGFYTFAITFLGLYILNASKYAIDNFMSEDIQAIYGIIIMPATVMSLFGQFIIHPFLNKFVEYCNNKKQKEFNNLIIKLIGSIILVGVLASILGYFLGIPVLNILYGIELDNYSIHLLVIIIAATLYTIALLLSSILTTVRYTFIQFIIYMANTILALALSNILVKNYGINGAIGSYFAVMFLLLLMYAISTNVILKKVFKEKKDEQSNNCNSGI